MGSYSEMYFADFKIPPGRGELSEASPYLLARHHVPILWLALFHAGDIFDVPAPDDPDAMKHSGRERWPFIAARSSSTPTTTSLRR